jgi:hypothetical protein
MMRMNAIMSLWSKLNTLLDSADAVADIER